MKTETKLHFRIGHFIFCVGNISAGKVGSKGMSLPFLSSPLDPTCSLMKTVSKKGKSTGLRSVLDSLLQICEWMWAQEKTNGHVTGGQFQTCLRCAVSYPL